MTKLPRTLATALAATLALLVVPAPALAEYLVPEGNSAVTQYTEGFPTAGGEKKTEGSGAKKPVTPAKAIGAANAKKLEDHGPDGTAVAEVAAETAPAGVSAIDSGGGSGDDVGQPQQDSSPSQGDTGKGKPAKDDSKQVEEETGGAPAGGSGEGPSGSSAIGEILAAATGSSSSGQLGLLLPLAILGAVVWAGAFLWRQHKPDSATVKS